MSTRIHPSLIDPLTAFTARLDGLREDQSPDDLSDALRTAFKQRELYKLYVCSLVGDKKRAMRLLEVFDKARSVNTLSRGLALTADIFCRPFKLPPTMRRFSSGFDNYVVRRGFYQLPTTFPRNSSKQLNIPSPPAVLAMFGEASTTTNKWR